MPRFEPGSWTFVINGANHRPTVVQLQFAVERRYKSLGFFAVEIWFRKVCFWSKISIDSINVSTEIRHRVRDLESYVDFYDRAIWIFAVKFSFVILDLQLTYWSIIDALLVFLRLSSLRKIQELDEHEDEDVS